MPASSATASCTTSRELGWRDIVQIDKGALPNPGARPATRRTSSSSLDHSREITDLTLDSVRQYEEMGVFTESGGFELARTEERMEELRRRMSSAKAWGIEAELVSPEFVKEKVPFIETDQFIGAFWHARRRRRRLAARRHDHARAGAGARRPDRRTHVSR